MTQFEAELQAEITEENILSECEKCNGVGIRMEVTEFGESPIECECLKKYHDAGY